MSAQEPIQADAASAGPRLAPRRFGPLRLGAFHTVEALCRRLGGRRWYRGRHLARGRFLLREETVEVPALLAELEGFRVAQLSDLHAGPFLGPGDLRAVVDAVNERRPDVVALTGDFITHRWHECLGIAGDLARLAPREGCFAVFGNHDYEQRREGEIERVLAGSGITFLRNASRRILRGAGALALVGVEDLEEGRVVDVAAARAGLAPGDVEILLCHNPHGARALARPGCVAILSGHTHGHQIDLPLVRRLGPHHPGERIDLGSTQLLVSRGLGVVGIPLRIGAPAEVVELALRRAPEGEAAG